MAGTCSVGTTLSIADLINRMPSFGERTALRFRTDYRGFSWSYRRLHDSIVRMASMLHSHGIRPGDRVMLWAPNGPPWVIAFLGCLLVGGVIVPIDSSARPSFVRDIARETEARLIVRTRFMVDAELTIPTVLSEYLPEMLRHGPLDHPVLPRPSSTDMAEIVYTSGTTARPKGVVLTHGNIAAALSSIGPVVPLEPEYRFLVVLPLSHILGQVVDLLLPLRRGATIVLLQTVKPAAIATALQRERITVLVSVPRLLELLRDQILGIASGSALRQRVFALLLATAPHLPFALRRWLFRPVHRRLGADLKYMVSGGAALDPALAQFWDRLGFLILQGYGLTETASAVACERIDARRIGSVGKVLPGQEVRLGAQGELLVSGPNVTPGYYADPTATAASFQDGWFRTGDVGYIDPNDFVYIKGRLKEVIVTSAGVNVYPADIEAALTKQPGVRDAVVVEWQGMVHAVLLLLAGVDARHIVSNANRDLDSAQQLQAWTVWPFADFPRGATLKARKRDVLEFLARRQIPEEAGRSMRGPVERLQALIDRVSGVALTELRPDTTLGFDLKLGSIDRLELVALIEQELSVDLADEDVASQTTVGELERMIGERRLPLRRAFPRWARSRVARALRDALQRWLLFPVLGRLIRLRVLGIQHLSLLGEEACIFAANHQSYLDPAVIAIALPEPLRQRTAVAAWAEYFEAPGRSLPVRLLHRLQYYASVLLVNAFPLPQARIFRPSLQYMGELAEEGENVLFFPEGRRTPTGEMGSFHEGIGLIATALSMPVVPVRIEGLFDLVYHGDLIPKRGEVTVTFGSPLTVGEDESYQAIAKRVERAVRAL